MYTVYRIEKDGMNYIGCTSGDLKKRVACHRSKKTPFTRGKFDVITLDKTDDHGRAMALETYYIGLYGSSDPEKGWNKQKVSCIGNREDGRRLPLLFDGNLLKKERIRQGYTYGQLAKKIMVDEPKISKTHIWAWEHEEYSPSIRYLLVLCKALGRPYEYFLKK